VGVEQRIVNVLYYYIKFSPLPIKRKSSVFIRNVNLYHTNMTYNQKESKFNTHIRIRKDQLEWLNENKTTKTTAGYLDKIINEKKRRLGKDKVINPLSKEINNILTLYTAINPVINYGHYANRKAVENLIKKFGYDNAYVMTKKAISVQGRAFAPLVDTPSKLLLKMGALKIYFQRNSNKEIQSI